MNNSSAFKPKQQNKFLVEFVVENKSYDILGSQVLSILPFSIMANRIGHTLQIVFNDDYDDYVINSLETIYAQHYLVNIRIRLLDDNDNVIITRMFDNRRLTDIEIVSLDYNTKSGIQLLTTFEL